jgi:ubiquinone/menaquinone biosynthesis C-methylase UbiE
VRSAVGKRTKSPGRRLRYAVADGRQLPFASETFDIVVFGWSL